MITTHNLGLPKNATSRHQTVSQKDEWKQQIDSDFLSVGCTGVSDPMVTMMDLLGHQSLQKQFKAYEESQWFGSKAHFVVPEFTEKMRFSLDATALIKEVKEAKLQGLKVKPIIIGPISYLWFGEAQGNVNKLELLEPLLAVYADLLQTLSDANVEWVQLDEPVLTQAMNENWKHALVQAYFHLQRSPVKKLLASYFGKLGDNLGLLRELTVDGVHLDTISAEDEALKVADWLPNYKIISVAVVDGNQLTEIDLNDTLAWLKPIHNLLGDRLWIAPSCSFIHMTKDVDKAKWIETSQQKLSEVKLVASALDEAAIDDKKQEIIVRRAAA